MGDVKKYNNMITELLHYYNTPKQTN